LGPAQPGELGHAPCFTRVRHASLLNTELRHTSYFFLLYNRKYVLFLRLCPEHWSSPRSSLQFSVYSRIHIYCSRILRE
jgi:hypothetical protein